MIALEIVLLLGGIACIAASYFIGRTDKNTVNADAADKELSSQDIQNIKAQIDKVVDEHISDVAERTEARLDKISNTKILEMSDYAEAVINQINKNHNEAVFLYDMLNEKAKEVKNTVKQVNSVNTQMNTRKNTPGNYSDTKASVLDDGYDKVQINNKLTGKQAAQIMKGCVSDVDESTDSSERSKTSSENLNNTKLNTSLDNNADKNDKILELYLNGLSDKEIAKELNLSVGEVKLVADLYKSAD